MKMIKVQRPFVPVLGRSISLTSSKVEGVYKDNRKTMSLNRKAGAIFYVITPAVE